MYLVYKRSPLLKNLNIGSPDTNVVPKQVVASKGSQASHHKDYKQHKHYKHH